MTAKSGRARALPKTAFACLLALGLGGVHAAPDTGPKTLNLDTLDLNGGVFGSFHLNQPISLDTRKPTSAMEPPMAELGTVNPLDDPQRFAGIPATDGTSWEMDLDQWMENARASLLTVPETEL